MANLIGLYALKGCTQFPLSREVLAFEARILFNGGETDGGDLDYTGEIAPV